MTYPDLPEVGARLEKTVERLAAARPSDDRMQLYKTQPSPFWTASMLTFLPASLKPT
jgi:hypothetical protein